MKKSYSVVVGFFVLLSMCNCATQTIQVAKDLSSSGIAYTEAVDNLLDVTTDRVIEFDTQVLEKARRGPEPRDTKPEREMIIATNEAIREQISEIEEFRSQTKLLKTYFLNLQALATSPVEDDAGMAIQALSDSMGELNTTLEREDSRVRLTDKQKQQIASLGGLAAKSIHAMKIKRALSRDAEIVGIYLAHQENQLKNFAGMLKDRFEAENDLFLNEKIIAPYVERKPLGAEWASNRKRWIKAQFVNERLDTAQEAAKQLRGVWADILQGKPDLNALSVLISDVNEFVTTAQALEEGGDSD